MKRSSVGSVMTDDVVQAGYDTSFKEVTQLLVQHRIGGVPVVDADRKVLGVVCGSDLLARQVEADDPSRPPHRFAWPRLGSAARRRRGKARARTAGQLMSCPAVTVSTDATLADAARTMARHRIDRLPVVDARQHLVGIVTRHDLIRIYLRPDGEIHDEIISEIAVGALSLAPLALGVSVHGGVVVLNGQLERRSDIGVAVRMVGQIDGVVAVTDQLTFRLDDAHVKPDEKAVRGVADDWLRRP
ncbi:CBS domain-containing protein [Streptomyces polyrhachis]|uniref:CBS domain-containing protein n=1 Tax=Streptomyces polyrhachis TaxID=1282885 RepID=A0ABW2G848_9ACTN